MVWLGCCECVPSEGAGVGRVAGFAGRMRLAPAFDTATGDSRTALAESHCCLREPTHSRNISLPRGDINSMPRGTNKHEDETRELSRGGGPRPTRAPALIDQLRRFRLGVIHHSDAGSQGVRLPFHS
jgi:hypothetical protein